MTVPHWNHYFRRPGEPVPQREPDNVSPDPLATSKSTEDLQEIRNIKVEKDKHKTDEEVMHS